MKRVTLKRGNKSLKRSPFKRRAKPKEQIEEERKEKEDMWRMFLRIWQKVPHYCMETGVYLGEEPLTIYFHHFLYKEKYPEFKLKEWNIGIVSRSTHELTHKNVDKTPKIKYKTEWLLNKYVKNE